MVAQKRPSDALAEDEAFPRGGGGGLTALDKRQIREQAEADADRDFLQESKRRKKAAKGADEGGDEDLFFAREAGLGKLPKFVELLKYKALSEGSKVWGSILEVSARELVVSLPHGIRGHVAPEQASDVLAELYKKAEKAAAAAVASGKQRKIRLPALPDLFYPGQLVSVEDHGYTLTFGIKGVTGFLKRSDHEASYGADAKLQPGMLVECAVTGSANRRMVNVTTEPQAVVGAVTKEWDGLTIGSLVPGALVNVRVRNVLSDGLLVSFLTYFNGTVDCFHLAQDLPAADWKKAYSPGQRLRARILFVDAAAKRVCLSLLPHLVGFTLKPSLPAVGQVFQEAVVRRVDGGLGLLLELPTIPAPSPGFVHISNVSDAKVEKLDKAFKVGQTVGGRVIGQRPMDGLAVVSLKASVVEQQLLSYADVLPGSLVTGTVAAIEDYGMFVSLSTSIRALVPSVHMSDLNTLKARTKYAVGQKVRGRVLEVDPAARRITMSLKKGLVTSKLPPLVNIQDAVVGARSHGTVTGVTEVGVFVAFCNGLKGLAHSSELGLAPGQKPTECFEVGQVVKCRVLAADTSQHRLRLSLVSKKAGADAGAAQADPFGGLQAGDVVEGIVKAVRTGQADGQAVVESYTVDIPGRSAGEVVHGRLEAVHLADHPAGVEALQKALAVGTKLSQLLVLDRLEGLQMVKLTRKASLVAAAATLPHHISGISEAALLPGYIASIAPDAVFVRFLGQLTGRAGLAQLSDTFVSEPARHFSVGQSVRCQVAQVDAPRQRFTLTLKHSLVASRDAALLRSLFCDLELADQIKAERGEGAHSGWALDFPIGGRVSGKVHEVNTYGLVCDLDANPDVLGLIASHQLEGPAAIGTPVSGRVLDINKGGGLVDLSVKADLVAAIPKKTKSWKVGKAVEAVVQLVHQDYLVLSVAEPSAIGFAATADFNLQPGDPQKRYSPGQKLPAVVAHPQTPETGGRLLLHVPLLPHASSAAAAKKRGKEAKALASATRVKATITSVHPLHLDVKTEGGLRGRVHITEVVDAAKLGAESPLETFTEGETVDAVVLGLADSHEARNHHLLELSLRPEMIEKAASVGAGRKVAKEVRLEKLKPGQVLQGFVAEVEADHMWMAISPSVRGRVFVLDTSDDLSQLRSFEDSYKLGQPLRCRVVRMDQKKHELDLSLRMEPGEKAGPSSSLAAKATPGTVLAGRVAGIEGRGVMIQLGPHTLGKAALTDLHDGFVANALAGLAVGDFVKCCMVARGKAGLLHVSLRPSEGGQRLGPAIQVVKGATDSCPASDAIAAGSLKAGDRVAGYVKQVSDKGLFVVVSRDLDARIKLSQLADGFVADPQAQFPEGKLVVGRVLSVSADRVELTLKSGKSGNWTVIEDLAVGAVVRGKVKRVEKFGVFVELAGSAVTGLAHISEVADEFIKNINDLFAPGQAVKAKVLDVDTSAQRLSLGLKPSYFADDADNDDSASQDDLDADMAAAASEEDESDSGAESDEKGALREVQDSEAEDYEEGGGESDSEKDATAGSSGDEQDIDELMVEAEPAVQRPDAAKRRKAPEEAEKKLSKAQRKRVKEAAERAIRQAELARLSGDAAPQSAVEYERLVMASPNSSYVWIKFIAFLISLGEVDGARAVAEKALKTINYREEAEKFNVWVAYLNLENLYGSPPDEAVMKLFQRALAYTDQKKLYLAMLGITERTNKEELSAQVLKAMTRKFGSSCKVWLRQLAYALRQGPPNHVPKLLDKAIVALPKRKHIKLLSQAALLEFKAGSAERARSIFEGILRNYPKRLDLWSMYLDQEIKIGEQSRVRALFERGTHLQLPAKKMKFLFKRYLEYEKAHGNTASVAHVKQSALEYVEHNINN
ncbi:hypothetical protein WJX72_001906 [[Myrmecia] bisecta]|uniref:S1 motif domain-containing protein n=1 Tax=[Myrmecia] bisecta TaxID=41462 RepID=A0AAW1QPF8_9CHLO